MADTLTKRASFDIRFDERPPDDCCCPICLSVMKDPHLTSCCGRHFCQRCINRIQELGQTCPVCKESHITTLFDRQLRNRINALMVHCPMETVGCLWRGRLEQLDLHLNVGRERGECQFIFVPCPFGCEEHHRRKSLLDHMRKKCVNRHHQCPLCYQCGSSTMAKEHHPNCPNRSVTCPNGCPINVKFREIDEHVNNLCPYREVDCKFHGVGCTTKIKYKDVPRHLIENASGHLDLIRQVAQQLRVKGTVLEEGYLEVAGNSTNMERLHTELKEKVASLEGKCGEYERMIRELQGTVQSLKEEVSALKMPATPVRPARPDWVRFSSADPLAPALSTPALSTPALSTPALSTPAFLPFVEEGEIEKEDLSCSFRP